MNKYTFPGNAIQKIIDFLLYVKHCRNWHAKALDYLGLVSTPFIRFDLRKGHSFLVRSGTHDAAVMCEIFFHGIYDVSQIAKKQNLTVIDVGAHIGGFSVFLHQHASVKKIVCVEPIPANVALLKKNISLNSLGPVSVIYAGALWITNGTLRLHHNDNTANSGILSKGKIIKVPCMTLHALLKKNNLRSLDVLKLDCEGAEFEILQQAQNILPKICWILMEYHPSPERTYQDILRLVSEKFAVTYHHPKEHIVLFRKK